MPEPANGNIAILVNHLHPYQISVTQGIQEVLDTLGWSSTVYVGGELQTPLFSHAPNRIFQLVHPELHQGVIVLTVALGVNLTTEDLCGFFQALGPLPVVSLGRPVPGVPSVLTDNTAGMRDLMDHLIDQQGFTRFAFMRGIEGNRDSMEREQVYREKLSGAGLPLQEGWMLTGNFSSQEARDRFSELLHSGADVQVVVCANDEMAEGCMQAIRHHGLRVPQDIAVVGFDDSDRFRHVSPALTTVRQPFTEQGEVAARMLLDLLEGKKVPAEVQVPTQLVVRESSGAKPASDPHNTLQLPQFWQHLQHQTLEHLRQSVLAQDPTLFLDFWKGQLMTRVHRNEDFSHWHDLLTFSLHQVEGTLAPGEVSFLSRLKTEVYGILVRALQMTYAENRLEDLTNSMWNPHLFTSESPEQLLHEIRGYLSRMQIVDYLLVFTEGDLTTGTSRVVLQQGTTAHDPEPFPTPEVFPRSFLHRHHAGHHILSPLTVGSSFFGWLWHRPENNLFIDEQGLAMALSRAVHQARQQQALRLHNETLEQEVALRTQRLQAEITERIHAQKALQVAHHELQRFALLDGLTQLYNRAAFNDHLQRQWATHLRNGEPLGVVLCDVDFFKRYNDHYGHLQGDRCLQDVAGALQRAVRRGDMVARYGGEEFVVILPETGLQQALMVAQRILQAVQDLTLPHVGSPLDGVVTLSLGVASLVPTPDLEAESLINLADQHLYQAKNSGRGRVVGP